MVESGPVQDSQVLVALGKNWKRSRCDLSIESKMTALAAGEMFVRGMAGLLILSGGKTAGGDRPSEAEAMYAFMRRHFSRERLPDDVVILEGRALDTAGNAEEVRDVLRRHGLRDVAILTTGYHMPAARTLFANFSVSVEDVFASEEILLQRSGHHAAFVQRWRPSTRVRVERARELIRRVLLTVDRKGKALRPITRLMRNPSG